MQTENLFEFLYIILDKKKVTASEMAKHFGVSVRTIYRWVDSLCISGVPLFMIKGKGGGISVEDSYSIDATVLNAEERLSLVSSIKALKSLTGAKKDSALDTVATKLSHLVKQNTDWIQLDFKPWNPEGIAVQSLFETLKHAILNQHQITFDYFSQNKATTNRSVQPWTIVFRGQAWYLYGYCNVKTEPRFFKLTRIKNLKVLQKSITQKKIEIKNENQYEQNYEQQNENLIDSKEKKKYEEQYPIITVNFIVEEKSIYRIMDELLCDEFIKNENGTYTIEAKFPKSNWLENWVLSFGSSIKVVEPKWLKENILEEAKKILEQ